MWRLSLVNAIACLLLISDSSRVIVEKEAVLICLGLHTRLDLGLSNYCSRSATEGTYRANEVKLAQGLNWIVVTPLRLHP